jgi:DNA-binding response OmpR family regulator
MLKQAIYMSNGIGPDPAIQKGLIEAGCEVYNTHNIAETVSHLKGIKSGTEQGLRNTREGCSAVLVAEVQAGAIPLLTLIRDLGEDLPPTLVFDREGNDIHTAIKALQLGVRSYLLASDPEIHRELGACVLAGRTDDAIAGTKLWERTRAATAAAAPGAHGTRTAASTQPANFEWDPVGYVIRVGNDHLRVSPIEGRIFDLLFARRGQTVSTEELIGLALRKPALDVDLGARQLRPHMMRLRNKLRRYSALANRIVNVRGSGYMLI